jgi:hypothetical protein
MLALQRGHGDVATVVMGYFLLRFVVALAVKPDRVRVRPAELTGGKDQLAFDLPKKFALSLR